VAARVHGRAYADDILCDVAPGRLEWAEFERRFYRWTVVDLADTLNRFNRHASLFDAQPNEAAQRAMADAAFRAIGPQP
jgi:hypothetical protein